MFAVFENRKECETVAKGFENRWNFPHVLGTVDGEHITYSIQHTCIVPPLDIGSYYYDYTATDSVLLMAVGKENYEFILADFGVNSCVSDGGILECTEFYNMRTV